NLADAAAAELVRRHLHLPATDDGAANVLVTGRDGIAESVLLHVARVWDSMVRQREPRPQLHVTLAGADAKSWVEGVRRRHPRLPQICSLEAWDADELQAAFEHRDSRLA